MVKKRICGIQIKSIPCKIEANIHNAVKWMSRCSELHRASLMVFPETFTTGFHTGLSGSDLSALVDVIPGRTTEGIQEAAKKYSANVVWPTYERAPEGKVYNSAVLITSDGEIGAVYRKIHPFPTEKEWTVSGGDICVVDTDAGRIGLSLCYDGDFPELYRIMALKGAEIIVRPSAFIRSFDTWELTNCARAYDSNAYIVGVNCVGSDSGANIYYGHSMIVSPQGRRIAQASSGEQIVYADIDMDIRKYAGFGCDTRMISDNIKLRRPDMYGELV